MLVVVTWESVLCWPCDPQWNEKKARFRKIPKRGELFVLLLEKRDFELADVKLIKYYFLKVAI